MGFNRPIFMPGQVITDNSGNPESGATIEFYTAGTLTPLTVYSDNDLTQSLGTVVTTNANGYPATNAGQGTETMIYTGVAEFKVIIKDQGGATLREYDNVTGALDTALFIENVATPEMTTLVKSSDYTILVADRGKLIEANPSASTITLTLPDAADASGGDGWLITVAHKGTANSVIIKPVSGQTINGGTSYILTRPAQSVTIDSNGANYTVVSSSDAFRDKIIEVTDRALNSPPSQAVAGSVYINGATPSGAWATGTANITMWRYDGIGGWIKEDPVEPTSAWIADENLMTVFYNAAWHDFSNVEAPQSADLREFSASYELGDTASPASIVTGSYVTVPFNTQKTNTITSASLNTGTGVLTLPRKSDGSARKYMVFANVALQSTGDSVLRLYNSTTSSEIAFGSQTSLGAAHGICSLFATVTITAETEDIKLDVRASQSGGSFGSTSDIPGVAEYYGQLTVIDLDSLQGPQGPAGPQGPDSSGTSATNFLINGDFAINQRGFAGGALTAGSYGHDRWKADTGGANYSVSGSTVTLTSGTIVQIIEAPNLAGEEVTLGIGDLSGGDLNIDIEGQTGTITAGSGRKGATVTMPGGSTGNISVKLTPASGAVTFNRVQLERGASASQLQYRFQSAEIALCQRYYRKGGTGMVGHWAASTVANLGLTFPNPMRANPTATLLKTTIGVDHPGGTRTGTGVFINAVTVTADGFFASFNNFSGATTGNGAFCVTADVIGFDAEL